MLYDTTRVADIVRSALEKHGLKPREASVRIEEHYAEIGERGVHPSKIYDVLRRVRVSRDNLRKILEGLGEDPEPALVAAGYSSPSDLVEDVMSKIESVAGYHKTPLTTEDYERIKMVVREVAAKYETAEDS